MKDGCKLCAKKGSGCHHHPDAVQKNAVANTRGWQEAYFEALRRGHTKASAAGIAGVAERTPYSRAERDEEFAEAEQVAYQAGTAALVDVALARIADPKRPGDVILKHLLSVRGISEKTLHEHSGPDGGPIDTTVDLSKLSADLLRQILAEVAS